MAQFDESKVINALHPEKAEIGKKYWCSDVLHVLKTYIEDEDKHHVFTLDKVLGYSHPFRTNNIEWQFIYPYEEPPTQRMTNIQLMEWISKRNGIFKHERGGINLCYLTKACEEEKLNDKVDENIVIRSWDSEEWVEPTVDIYERDCKGGTK